MPFKHHPQAESLMSCSAGSMPEAFAAVMSSHLTMCSSCQKDLALMEKIGVALFDKLAATPVLKDAPVIALRAGEAGPDRDDTSMTAAAGDVPAPLVSVLDRNLSAIKWKRVSPGVWQHVIPLNDTRASLRLIKVAPGQALPEHAHTGSELTLVLKGAYSDETGEYGVGDVADMMGDAVHSPIADDLEGCICLIATEGKLKFRSLLARFVQPFTGI